MTSKPVLAASASENVLFPDPASPVTMTRRPTANGLHSSQSVSLTCRTMSLSRRSGMLGTRGPIRGSGTFGGNTAAGRYPPGMDLRMSEDERQAFLAGVHIGVISIEREDGPPLTVPIWYGYEPSGNVWVTTGTDSLKSKLLHK